MTTLFSCFSHDIICDTGECLWLHLDLIKSMLTFCNNLFPVTSYAYCTIPTYPSGQIGFVLCSKNPVNTHSPVTWFIVASSQRCIFPGNKLPRTCSVAE